MTFETDTAQFLCLKCQYDIAGIGLGEVCPECGTTVDKLVDQSTLNGMKAFAVLVAGILSLISVLSTFTALQIHYFLPLQIFGISTGLFAIIYGVRVRYGVRIGQVPFRSLGYLMCGRICGFIGFTLSMILAIVWIIGGLLVRLVINNVPM